MFLNKLKNRTDKTLIAFVEQSIRLPIYSFNLADCVDNEKLCAEASSFKKDDIESRKKELVDDGYQTSYLYKHDLTDQTNILNLLKIIEEKSKLITGKQNSINVFWFVFYNKDTEHKMHNHVVENYNREYPLSAAYYVKAEENSSPIIFKNNQKSDTIINVKTGQLLIFHSGLLHYVPKSESSSNRITLSCNLI